MTIDYTVTINGKPADKATGPGRVVVTVPAWLGVFVDVSSGPVLNFTNGKASWDEVGEHDLGDFKPGEYVVRVANSDGQGKLGFYFPLTVPFAAAEVKVKTKRLIISDVGSYVQVSSLMGTVGADGQRVWCSIAPDGTVDAAKLAYCNNLTAAGFKVIACVSMNKHNTAFPDPVKVGDYVNARLRPDTYATEWGNEINKKGDYTPGSTQETYAFYNKCAARCPNHNNIAPSQATDDGPAVVKDIKAAQAAGNFGNFKGVAAHEYHDDSNGKWTPNGVLERGERNITAIQSLGMPVHVTEFGCDGTYTLERKKTTIPLFAALYERMGVASWAFYLLTRNGKAEAEGSWAIDLTTGAKSETYDAVKAAYADK